MSAVAPLLPMRATVGQMPPDEGWAFEVKWDGYRALGVVEHGRLRLVSSRGNDFTTDYPELGGLAAHVNAGGAVLDGEIVVFDDAGASRFELLQRHQPTDGNAVYVLFDVLEVDGRPAVALPYVDRRRLLEMVVEPGPRWVIGPWQTGDGGALLDVARAGGLEGVMAKRLGSPYLPGKRSPTWRKVKLRRQQELVVAGWTRGTGNRSSAFGALLVGVHDAPRSPPLRFAGAVGSGFDQAQLRTLQARIAELAVDACPFDPPPPRPVVRSARWVRPELVAQVAFTEWTSEGLLRQPSFLGLRHDKDPADVIREPT